jgi:Ca2+-binding EF-hand superfamily protein
MASRPAQHTIDLACHAHGHRTSVSQKITVQEARKSVFVLCYGELEGPHCFEQDLLLGSRKGEGAQAGWVARPNGWKVCFVEQGDAWVMECRYSSALAYEYQCALLSPDLGEPVASARSECCPNPSQAYRRARDGLVKDAMRPNGQLFAGLYYTNPQKVLREHFAALLARASPLPSLGVGGAEWLANVVPSSRRPSPKAQPAAAAPQQHAAGGNKRSSADLVGGMGDVMRQLSVEDLREQLNTMHAHSSDLSEMWSKRREKLDLGVEERVFYSLNQSSASSPPAPSSPNLNKQDSMKEAMAYLRGLSQSLPEIDLDLPALNPDVTAQDLFGIVKSDAMHLDRAQMHSAVSYLLQLPVPREMCNKMFDFCDKDKDGRLSMNEFVVGLGAHEGTLKAEFDALDFDHDGAISLAQLKTAKNLGLLNDATEADIQALFKGEGAGWLCFWADRRQPSRRPRSTATPW